MTLNMNFDEYCIHISKIQMNKAKINLIYKKIYVCKKGALFLIHIA